MDRPKNSEPAGVDNANFYVINMQDRLLLFQKLSEAIYTPAPIHGLPNVWSTFFSLSKGLAGLTIIKTSDDVSLVE